MTSLLPEPDSLNTIATEETVKLPVFVHKQYNLQRWQQHIVYCQHSSSQRAIGLNTYLDNSAQRERVGSPTLNLPVEDQDTLSLADIARQQRRKRLLPVLLVASLLCASLVIFVYLLMPLTLLFSYSAYQILESFLIIALVEALVVRILLLTKRSNPNLAALRRRPANYPALVAPGIALPQRPMR
ncbi:MAG: hypothetical protein JO202_20210 [Ktedonobacteraceae bacterium]|nr:hypothetical protein [Ktedonobacteraceae bacterium]